MADPNKTTPYEFYQYWRNIEDASGKMSALMTFLPMDEVRRLGFRRREINQAKEVLAYELTKIVHGAEAADEAQAAARALFAGGKDEGAIPTSEIPKNDVLAGMDLISLLQRIGLISTRSEGRRLIQQGGIYLNGEQVKEFDYPISEEDFQDDELMVRKGKKVYHRVQLV